MFRTGFVGRQFASGLGAGTISGSAPSLNLDFTSGVLDSRITFTRASTATYFDSTGTMQSASNNVPRFDYEPVSRQMRGLLIEEARTNLLIQSGNIANAAWVGGVRTANASTAPDGTNSATRYAEGSGSGNSFQMPSIVWAATTTYTQSVFAKPSDQGTKRYLSVLFDTAAFGAYYGAIFDVAVGTITFTTAGASATIAAVGNGWYRCTATLATTTGATIAAQWRVGTSTTDIFQNTVGDSTSGFFIWGAQLEAGAFPTSYIPTTAAAVTRAAEIAVMTAVPGIINQLGTMAMEVMMPQLCNTPKVFASIYGTGRTSINVQASNNLAMFDTGSGLNTAIGAQPVGYNFKAAFAYQNGSQRSSVNGGAITSFAASGMSTPTPNVAIMSDGSGGFQPNGYIRRFRYWPRMLSDGDLISETGSPSLDIDLRATTIDPRITFARTTSGTYFNSAGILTTVGANVPRLDYNKDTLQPLGLLIEEQRTNSIRNSVAAGFTPGTGGIGGGGGAMPTNWVINAAANLMWQVSNGGVVNGIQCIDLRFVGTTTSTFIVFGFEGATFLTTTPGDVWALSAFVAVVGGSLAGINAVNLNHRFQGGAVPTTLISPTNVLTRFSAVQTAGAGATNFQPAMQISTQAGVPIDITLRLGAPQAELGLSATSYIPTSGAAATRQFDQAVIAVGPWLNPAAISLAGDFMIGQTPNPSATASRDVASLNDGTLNNRAALRGQSTGGGAANAIMLQSIAGTTTTSGAVFSPGINTTQKMAVAWISGTQAGAGNGGNVLSTANAGMPSGLTTLSLGNSFVGAGTFLNGYAQRVRVWPRQLSNAELQAVTR